MPASARSKTAIISTAITKQRAQSCLVSTHGELIRDNKRNSISFPDVANHHLNQTSTAVEDRISFAERTPASMTTYEQLQLSSPRLSSHDRPRIGRSRDPRSLVGNRIRAGCRPTSSTGYFDVRKYGATGDGKTLDTDAVNHAIEAAAAAGGGVVVFPAGNYLCFSIHLKSFVHLLLLQGSTIVAADSPLPGEQTGYHGGTYDAAEPKTAWDAYQDYGHNHWHNSLLWGEDIHDFSITGTGLIYGKGLSFGADRPARGDYPIYVAEQAGVGNKAIALKNCRNVLLRDFSILKAGHFGLLLTGVDNLTIDNLKIDTDRDGMDIDCCQNVRVSNCTVNSPWDDGICPKSSYALGYARPTRNLTITNCFVTGDLPARSAARRHLEEIRARGACAAYRTHQVRHRVERRLHQRHHLELRLRGLLADTRSNPKTAHFSKTSPSPTPPCATSSQGPSLCASAHGCAVLRKPQKSAR